LSDPISGKIINIKVGSLSIDSTIRGQTYNRWFWLMIPLLMYAFFSVLIRTGFKNWTQAAEDKEIDRQLLK
jgi:hypothetical protein